MIRGAGLLLSAIALVFGAIACASDDSVASTAQSAEFNPGPVVERNATPTPTPTAAATATPTATATPDPTPTATPTPRWPPAYEISDLLDGLIDDVEQKSAGVAASIAVGYDDLVVVATNGLEKTPSASLAKSWWVAAALDEVGVEAVAPFAEAIFAVSDNDAAAEVIDLVGVDVINATTAKWNMRDTYLASWTLTSPRLATDRNRKGTANVTTTLDAARFMRDVVAGDLLGPDETEAMTAWMSLTPDRRDVDPYGSVLVADLPAAIAASAAHKAGWLPPECCDKGPDHEVLISAGVIPCAPAPVGESEESFSLAVATVDGADYLAQLDWTSEAAASIAGALCPNLERGQRHDGDGDQQRRQ